MVGGPVPVPGNTHLFAFWASVSCLCRERLKAKGSSWSLSSALLPQTTTIELGKLRPKERQESPLCRCRRSKHVVGAAHGPCFPPRSLWNSGAAHRHPWTVHTCTHHVPNSAHPHRHISLCACAPPPAGTGFKHSLCAIWCASLSSTIMLTEHGSSRMLSDPR